MSKTSKYFQFPICLLHAGKPIDEVTDQDCQELINRIIRRGVLHVADSSANALFELDGDENWQLDQAVNTARRYESCGFDENDRFHLQLAHACEVCGVKPGDVDNFMRERQRPLPDFGSRYVRIRQEFAFEWRDYPDKPWRDFAVLCAIYSGIGAKPFARLSRDQIRAMAAGFNGNAEFAERHDNRRKDPRLSVDQTRWTIGILHQRRFFHRVCPNRRHTYYSHRLKAQQLLDQVTDHLTAKGVNKNRFIARIDEVARRTLQEKRARQ